MKRYKYIYNLIRKDTVIRYRRQIRNTLSWARERIKNNTTFILISLKYSPKRLKIGPDAIKAKKSSLGIHRQL